MQDVPLHPNQDGGDEPEEEQPLKESAQGLAKFWRSAHLVSPGLNWDGYRTNCSTGIWQFLPYPLSLG
jgi:hypothetical protein